MSACTLCSALTQALSRLLLLQRRHRAAALLSRLLLLQRRRRAATLLSRLLLLQRLRRAPALTWLAGSQARLVHQIEEMAARPLALLLRHLAQATPSSLNHRLRLSLAGSTASSPEATACSIA